MSTAATLLGGAIALAIMWAGVEVVARAFHHEHTVTGRCGWSGCQEAGR